MNVLWHKVWYDLWRNKLRTLLVVLSIAVGVFAVGVTFGMVEQMLPTMDADHRSTLPSHVTMFVLGTISRDDLYVLEKIPGVEQIEPVNAIEVNYKINPGSNWRNGFLWMRDDYENQEYDTVQLDSGNWPEGEGISIERMHSPFYGINLGDQVILEIDEEEHKFPITGIIRAPFVPPPSMWDIAYFFCGEEVMERFDIPRGRFSQFKFQVDPYTPENARRIASEVKEHLDRQGFTISGTTYQDPNKHWGRSFIEGMTMVIQVMAVLSLLLSVVLVLNTLTAIITQQTNQIGILKAIGGSSLTVTRLYLIGVLVYGILALSISLPLGTLASFKVSQWFLGFYNINYMNYTLSPHLILIQVLAALVVPLIAALFPVLHGAAITVRQAISSYGLGGDFGSGRFDRFIEHFSSRFLKSYYAAVITNTFRRKGRLVLSQVVLVTAGVMYLMVMSLSSSLKATMDADFSRRDYDLVITFEDFQRVDRTTADAKMNSGVQKAGMWLIVPATIFQHGQKLLDAGAGSQLNGVPLDDPQYQPLIVEGRWLMPGDDRAIVMNKETAEDENIKVGDTITLDLGEMGEGQWTLVGTYRVFLFFGGSFYTDAIFAPRQAVFEATKKNGQSGTLLVRTFDRSDQGVAQVSKELEDYFKKKGMKISASETMPDVRRTADSAFGIVIMMLKILAFLVVFVGGIGLMGSLWISVIERTKEIGIMRSIGALSGTIMAMFVLEGVLQGVLSWIIAIPIAFFAAPYLANALGQAMFQAWLEFEFNYPAVFIWLGIILVVAVLASIIPARNAASINVRDSLTYE